MHLRVRACNCALSLYHRANQLHAVLQRCTHALTPTRRTLHVACFSPHVCSVVQAEHYLKRLDAGLAVLQHVDLILGELVYQCGVKAGDRVASLVRLKSSPFSAIADVLREYADNIDISVAGGEAARDNVAAIVSILELRKDE
jgi:hypothetical protein